MCVCVRAVVHPSSLSFPLFSSPPHPPPPPPPPPSSLSPLSPPTLDAHSLKALLFSSLRIDPFRGSVAEQQNSSGRSSVSHLSSPLLSSYSEKRGCGGGGDCCCASPMRGFSTSLINSNANHAFTDRPTDRRTDQERADRIALLDRFL